MLFDYVAVLVQFLLHHVGLIEISPVDAGRLCGDKLNGGNNEVLSECVAGQIDIVAAKFLTAGEHAASLALEVHTGGREEPKLLQVVIKR